MGKRLIKLNDRPRENYKEVSFLCKLTLQVDNLHGDAINDLDKFKQWVSHTFTQWDQSILEYFLYEYKLLQNDSDDDKYKLDFKVESILRDDTTQPLRPMVEDGLSEETVKQINNEE